MIEQWPTVSVCCITYNHAQFLSQTIESVLMQQTNFDIEMVIGEDCSTDNTRAIAQEYEKNNPGRIRVLTPSANLGIMSNLMATMAACTGEFVAFLEGDDYWTDTSKLQRQVEAMRTNPNCSFCFHDAKVIYEFQLGRPSILFSQQATHALPPPAEDAPFLQFTQTDLACVGWVVPSASMLFRAASLPQPIPNWFVGVHSGDYTLHLLSTRWGPALYLPRVMSAYRLHAQSISIAGHKSELQFERRIHEGKMFKQHVFEAKDVKYANIYLAKQYGNHANYFLHKGKMTKYIFNEIKFLYFSRQRITMYLERWLRKLMQS